MPSVHHSIHQIPKAYSFWDLVIPIVQQGCRIIPLTLRIGRIGELMFAFKILRWGYTMQDKISRDRLKRMLRLYRFLVFALACVITTGCTQMEAGMEEISTRLKDLGSVPRSETVTADRLNLRKEPTTKSQVLTQLKKGDRVTIHSQEDPWVKVTTEFGSSGWVHSAYLTGFGSASAGHTTLAKSDKDTQEKDLTSDAPIKPALPPQPVKPPKPVPIEPHSQPKASQALKVYPHPRGEYQIKYPATWKLREDLEADPEIVALTSQSRKAELWIVSSPVDIVQSLDNFYLDLVRPLAQQFQEAVSIDPLTDGVENGVAWRYGRAVVNEEPKEIYKYSLTQHKDRFWSIVLVARAGIPEDNIDILNAIRASFAFKTGESGSSDKKTKTAQRDVKSSRQTAGKPQGKAVVFKRITEPREQAFTVLIPQGWQVEGGIVRVNPLTQGGPAQSIAAKVDFIIKKDSVGTVMERWLPDITWYDPRWTPIGQMGMIRVGDNYQGMTVMPVMSAQDFLRQIVFIQYHPGVSEVKILETLRLPKLAEAYHQAAYKTVGTLASSLRYDAALMRVAYTESNMRYKEMLVTVIEDTGAAGTGMWNNKLTFFMRAPEDEYVNWEPIFAVINHSIRISPAWMAGEIKGQLTRNKILDKTQKEIQRIGREIADHRYRTNAEIQNDMFLTLMGQEEYVNPYTKEVEIGTDKWKHRWINESGDVLYTDNESYNPNLDVHLNRSDYKRTPIRKRFPQ